MILVYDPPTWRWLSKNYKDFHDFENYCLLIGIDVNYSPTEYGIKSVDFILGDIYPEYYHLDLLEEEEQALIEFAKIKNEEIELFNYRHRNDHDEQGESFYPFEPTDGCRMFGQDT